MEKQVNAPVNALLGREGGCQQGRKLPFPILFFIGLTLLPEIGFARHHSHTGHPLGPVSTGQEIAVPNSFLRRADTAA